MSHHNWLEKKTNLGIRNTEPFNSKSMSLLYQYDTIPCLNLIIVFISCIITVVLIIIVLMGSQQGLSHVCLVNACCICNEKWRGRGLL